ncbi:NAD(P)/FAD-dependent oxidoreductase [Roseovarius nitratireducens]|uniref:NAD(P)/FAD-dependent oxidoreductase n=1 Tax=Roseovarius nitratireducens TaxID=2044597 RepID=UPI000CE22E9D|nr:FAD-binding oxidoreductase [Roseovarius nitratireducens]
MDLDQIKTTPFWWEDTRFPETASALPARADLVIVGAGFTGLSAALEAAKSGMSVAVLEKGAIGDGASSRNGGQISDGMKWSRTQLVKRLGAEVVDRLYDDAANALVFAERLASELGVPESHQKNGRFCGAHSQKQFDYLRRQADETARAGRTNLTIIEKDRVHEEVGSDRYFGGLVETDFASLHPAKLLSALVRACLNAGVRIVAQCPAEAIAREGQGFQTQTRQGVVASKHVLVATNGYTDKVFPWARRRIIPIASHMLATQELPEPLQIALIPNRRNVVDTRKVVVYYRYSPDGKRLLFGGRAALFRADPARCASRLRSMMLDIYPQLADIGFTHFWSGFVGFTFDRMPHLGCHDGIHFCMGYSGSGVANSLYYGHLIGRRIAGQSVRIALENLPFPTVPLYNGIPWFLGPTVMYYQARDRFIS